MTRNHSSASTEVSRRQFILAATLATGIDLGTRAEAIGPAGGAYTGKLCFFSKHLSSMEPRRLARSLKQAGFTGIDLTVRRGGHVAPESAAQELPRAVAAIREEGLDVPMITTGLTSASDPTARPILSTAGKLSIPYYKPGYYRYDFVDVRKELEKAGAEFQRLAELGKQYGIQAGFHNHSGYIGAPVWDIATIIEPMDPRWVGYYFDVRHAVVEGGDAGWKIAANLVARRVKMIAVKDFYWERRPNRGWQIVDCPLGQGMVDWRSYFTTLAQAGFQGPISFHFEYEISGATSAAKEESTLAAARRDLEFVKARLQESYKEAVTSRTRRLRMPEAGHDDYRVDSGPISLP